MSSLARGFKKCDLDWLWSVCIVCCGERCLSLASVWVGGAVSSLVSVFIWCRQWEHCSCLCLKVTKKGENGGEGPSVAQYQNSPHSTIVSMDLVQECRDADWVVYQSYIGVLDGWYLRGHLALCVIVVVSSLKKWMLEMVVAECWCQRVSAQSFCAWLVFFESHRLQIASQLMLVQHLCSHFSQN